MHGGRTSGPVREILFTEPSDAMESNVESDDGRSGAEPVEWSGLNRICGVGCTPRPAAAAPVGPDAGYRAGLTACEVNLPHAWLSFPSFLFK